MNPDTPVVECKNISQVFKRKGAIVQALNNVSLQIYKGDFVSITGKNGSGKSTLLGILSGMEQPTSGAAFFNGMDLSRAKEAELTKLRSTRIGFIYQDFNLLRGYTVFENVKAAAIHNGRSLSENKTEITVLLDKLKISHRNSHYPSELSAGEQQRVAVARALINDPQVIFADEPTAEVDPEVAQEITGLLIDLNRSEGKTIIVTTHGPFPFDSKTRRFFLSKGNFVTQEAAGY